MPSFARLALFPITAVALVAFTCNLARATTETTVDLTPRVAPNDLAEVTLEVQVGGTMRVPKDRGRSAEVDNLPMSVAATFVYDEHRVPPAGATPATRSIRWYKQADATIKVDNDGVAPTLDEARRLVIAENPGGRLVLSSPGGLLEREELDLIDAVGDSLAVDGLLPKEPVANGSTWRAEPETIAALLSLDTVAACEVQSVLDKFNADFALVRIAGTAVGAVDSAATEIEIRGVYLFDRKHHRITKCNLAVKEVRSVGGATPGLDSVGKLRLTVRPIAESPHLTEAALAPLRERSKLRLDLLQLDGAKQGFRAIHDRRWFVTSSDRESTTLRRVDGSDVVAQCTITALPPKSAGRQTTLPEFEADIRRSLGDRFGELVMSRQWLNAYKHRCLEVVVRGTMEEVPVEWHYYLVAPEAGPRVSAAVTIEGPMLDRLAGADRTLVNAIQLLAASPTASPGTNAAGQQASQPAAPSSPAAARVMPPITPPAARPMQPISPPSASTSAPVDPEQPPLLSPSAEQRQVPWSARAQNLDRSMIVPGR